jgi:hypothetical protein
MCHLQKQLWFFHPQLARTMPQSFRQILRFTKDVVPLLDNMPELVFGTFKNFCIELDFPWEGGSLVTLSEVLWVSIFRSGDDKHTSLDFKQVYVSRWAYAHFRSFQLLGCNFTQKTYQRQLARFPFVDRDLLS